MTLLEKAKEMGIHTYISETGELAVKGCPYEHGLESQFESLGNCKSNVSCAKCYQREYKGDTTSTIKDSGDRTQFYDENGNKLGIRDMHEGKGRFDLLPMCVLMRLAKHFENCIRKYPERSWELGIPCHSFADSALRHMCKYMDGHTDEDHLIAAIWNLCGLAWTEEKKPELMDIPARKEAL